MFCKIYAVLEKHCFERKQCLSNNSGSSMGEDIYQDKTHVRPLRVDTLLVSAQVTAGVAGIHITPCKTLESSSGALLPRDDAEYIHPTLVVGLLEFFFSSKPKPLLSTTLFKSKYCLFKMEYSDCSCCFP